jgi:hypothetical protein
MTPIVPAGEIAEYSAGVAATDLDGVFCAAGVVWAGEIGSVVEEGDVDVICVPKVAEPGEEGVFYGGSGRVV